jgi:hypothetical protein
MQSLRHRINPQTFVITLQQIAKYLNINPKRILNWEKWYNVLWVYIEGLGSYFISGNGALRYANTRWRTDTAKIVD